MNQPVDDQANRQEEAEERKQVIVAFLSQFNLLLPTQARLVPVLVVRARLLLGLSSGVRRRKDVPVADSLSARDLETAGVEAIILESMTPDAGKTVTASCRIPTIGIGAGSDCDGQIRVIHDLIGAFPWFRPPFAVAHHDLAAGIKQAVAAFREEIS